jgi:hypothetical protein
MPNNRKFRKVTHEPAPAEYSEEIMEAYGSLVREILREPESNLPRLYVGRKPEYDKVVEAIA